MTGLKILTLFLILNVVAGLWRVIHGPSRQDRMAASMLFGTVGVATALLIAEITGTRAARDVALVLVIVAVITALVFVDRMASVSVGDVEGRTVPRGAAAASPGPEARR